MERKERGEKYGEGGREGGDVWKERENDGWGEKNSLAVWVKENVFVFLPPHPASREGCRDWRESIAGSFQIIFI